MNTTLLRASSELASHRTGQRRLCGCGLLPQAGGARAASRRRDDAVSCSPAVRPAPPRTCAPARVPRAPAPPPGPGGPAWSRLPPPSSSLPFSSSFNLWLLSCANCCSGGCSGLNGACSPPKSFEGPPTACSWNRRSRLEFSGNSMN